MSDWFVPGYGNINEIGSTTDYFMPGYGNLNEVSGAPPSQTILNYERGSWRGAHRGVMVGVG
jgi:hypothetical protein